jgi:hypothetical protein
MRFAVAIIVLCTTACGLTMTTGPDPRQPPNERPRCTETFKAPKRDGIGAVIGFVAVIFGAVALDAGGDQNLGAALLVGGLVVIAASYASGAVGYVRVKKCKKAISEYDRRVMTQPIDPAYPNQQVR